MDCPYCAEPLEDSSAERCPSCGERLGERPHEPARGRPFWFVLGSVTLALLAFFCLAFVAIGVTTRARIVRTSPPGPSTLPSAPLVGSASEAEVAALPVQTDAPTSYGDVVQADRRTYSWGGYGVTEIGSVRIAVRGLSFDGTSSGGVAVNVPAGSGAGGGGSTGVGERRFTHQTQNGVTTCTFASFSFTIQDGVLALGTLQLDVHGSPQTVVVDPDGGNPIVFATPR